MANNEIWLVRHGETAWSQSGQHTGWTDLDLLPEGEEQARGLGKLLGGRDFELVLTSPLLRAKRTCELAGYGEKAIEDPNLREWNYGSLEGKTANEMRETWADWTVWRNGAPNGETIEQVYQRAGKVLDRVVAVDGDVAIFAHGHFLRILACCYLGLVARDARMLALNTASLSILGWEREQRVIRKWNLTATD